MILFTVTKAKLNRGYLANDFYFRFNIGFFMDLVTEVQLKNIVFLLAKTVVIIHTYKTHIAHNSIYI